MKKEKVLGQLKKVSPEDFLAAGKFAPRGAAAGQVLGGAAGAATAAVVAKKIAKKKSSIELPRVFYLGLTESDVLLMSGKMGVTVTPTGEVLHRWPRQAVKATPKGGIRNRTLELEIEGVEKPVGALYTLGDSSAEEVVRLLSGSAAS